MIVYVGGQAFGVTPLNGLQWGVCIICAICCLPWAVVLRIIPDKQFGLVFNFAVNCMGFVLRPIQKGFSLLVQPLKRFSQRVFRREKKEDAQTHDEEAVALPDVKRQPTPEAPVTPVTVPPITITTS